MERLVDARGGRTAAWSAEEMRETEMVAMLPEMAVRTGAIAAKPGSRVTTRSSTSPEHVEIITAANSGVHPTLNNPRTYPFRLVRYPCITIEHASITNITVENPVRATRINTDAPRLRNISVMRSPNEDAIGVVILSGLILRSDRG